MPAWIRLCAQAFRSLCAGTGSFVLWSLWLALVLGLAAQAWVVSSHQLALPGFILRRLEERVAESGLRLTVGATSFDPTGRILVQDARLHLPAFAEPVLRIEALYLRLDRASLLAGALDPVEIRVTGTTLTAPAQLTPSGRGEELISGLDATVLPIRKELRVARLTGRSADLSFTAHGSLPLPPTGAARRLPWSEIIVERFPETCRRILAAQRELARCDAPRIDLSLAPGGGESIVVGVQAFAREVRSGTPLEITAREFDLSATLTLPAARPIAGLRLGAREVLLPRGGRATGVNLEFPGELEIDRVPAGALLALDRLEAEGAEAAAISAQLDLGA